jgi:hypothetical protein
VCFKNRLRGLGRSWEGTIRGKVEVGARLRRPSGARPDAPRAIVVGLAQDAIPAAPGRVFANQKARALTRALRAGLTLARRTAREAPSFAGTENGWNLASQPSPCLVSRTVKLLAAPDRGRRALHLALQLLYLKASESMGNHDSKVVDADSVD